MRQCLVCGQTACDQAACGQARDTADAMLARLTTSTQDQLRHLRQAGAAIKAQEEAASRARLAEIWAEEEERQAELAQARAERARRERRTIALALGLAAIVVVIAIIAAIYATGGAPSRFPRGLIGAGAVDISVCYAHKANWRKNHRDRYSHRYNSQYSKEAS
jgi:hypothetical protein